MKKLIWLAGAAFWVTACASLSTKPAPEPTPLAVAPTVKTVVPKAAAPATPPPGAVAGAEEEPAMKVVTEESQRERAEANKLKVRPIKNVETDAAVKAGKVVGPIVTYVGAARADGNPTEPVGKTKEGWPIFLNHVGSGFIIVVEAKPGFSNLEPGRSIFRYDPEDPSKRPDLEIQVDRPLGDGSEDVCDARAPKFGGIPAIAPMDFSETKKVTAAINDLSCRFETFIESDASCTNAPNGDFAFISGDEAVVQFCMVVARKWRFAEGDTTVSVRLRDREGNPGPISRFVIRRTDRPPRAPQTPVPATPTPVRRRP
jgi:hypothetical protein